MRLLLLVMVYIMTSNHPWTQGEIDDTYRYTIAAADFWKARGELNIQINEVQVVGKDDFQDGELFENEDLWYRAQPRDRMTIYWTKECRLYGGNLVHAWTYPLNFVVVKYCNDGSDRIMPAHEFGHWVYQSEITIGDILAGY